MRRWRTGMKDEAAFLAALAADPADEVTRLAYADWLDEHSDLRAAWVRDPDLWNWSAPDLHDPVPGLIDALADRTRFREVHAVLRKLGPAAVTALAARVRREDGDVDFVILRALGALGAAAAPVVPDILALWD